MDKNQRNTKQIFEFEKAIFIAAQDEIGKKMMVLGKIEMSLNTHQKKLPNENHSLVDEVINNGGELSEKSEAQMFEEIMLRKKIDLEKRAIEKLQMEILDMKNNLVEKANKYSTAYAEYVTPFINNELGMLLKEIDEVFSKRIGRFVGIYQAIKNPFGGNYAINTLFVNECDPLNVIMDKINHIIKKEDWVEYGLKHVPDGFPGGYPKELIKVHKSSFSPAQIHRMQHDVEYKKLASKGMEKPMNYEIDRAGNMLELQNACIVLANRSG